MGVRKVRVRVHEALVLVLVLVPFEHRDAFGVLVSMMPVIVAVTVTVPRRRVLVRVLVLLGPVKIQRDAHERACDDERDGERLARDEERQSRPDEGRRRKPGPRARRAQVSQREHEAQEAHAVAEQPDEEADSDHRAAGPPGAERERDGEVDRASDRALDRDDQARVGVGDLAGEIVVDRPAQARDRDRDGPCDRRSAVHLPGPREDRAGHEHEAHARGQSTIDLLAEDAPRDKRGEDRLEVEQERRDPGRRRAKAVEQREGPEHAAKEGGARQPTGVASNEPGAAAREAQREREADSRAEVQERREQRRRNARQQQAREGGARAKEHRRGDRVQNASCGRRVGAALERQAPRTIPQSQPPAQLVC